jgi:hypothetical protein
MSMQLPPDELPHDQQRDEADKIDVNDFDSRRYWATQFRITQDQLREAVKIVGRVARDLKSYLGK